MSNDNNITLWTDPAKINHRLANEYNPETHMLSVTEDGLKIVPKPTGLAALLAKIWKPEHLRGYVVKERITEFFRNTQGLEERVRNTALAKLRSSWAHTTITRQGAIISKEAAPLAQFIRQHAEEMNQRGWPEIFMAAFRNRRDIMELIGVDTLIRGRPPVNVAIDAMIKGDETNFDHLIVATRLIDAGAKTNPRRKNTALVHAALRGWDEGVQTLIRSGANVQTAEKGTTVAHVAAAKAGQVSTLEILQKAGADLAALNDEGLTPLEVTIMAGRSELVPFLAEHTPKSVLIRIRGNLQQHASDSTIAGIIAILDYQLGEYKSA